MKRLLENRISSFYVAAVFALGYFFIWSWLAAPFTGFPGDDVYTAMIISQADYSSFLESAYPVYYFFAFYARELCNLFSSAISGCESGEIVLHLAIASNSAITLLVGLIVFRLTGNLMLQVTAHALYALSAWPVTYHFMVSYTVTTAGLMMLALYFLVLSNKESRLLPMAAGISAALAWWSSPSGPLTVGLFMIVGALLLWKERELNEVRSISRFDLERFGILIAAFLVVWFFFAYHSFHAYLEHLQENIDSAHFRDANLLLGSIPELPILTYFHILKVYGIATLILSIASVFVLPFLIADEKPDKIISRTAIILTGYALLHGVLIDLLPSTKLARAHFPIYPIMVIVICLVGFEIYARLARVNEVKILPKLLVTVAIFAMLHEGLSIGKETHRVRTAVYTQLSDIRNSADWFLLHEDPHHGQMWLTFNWPAIDVGSIQISKNTGNSPTGIQGSFKSENRLQILQLIESDKLMRLIPINKRRPIGLILGPHGTGSGLSVAHHATTMDFKPDNILDMQSLRQRAIEIKTFPYYMLYPPFLLEEEITERLFFSRRTPDYRSPELGITIMKF